MIRILPFATADGPHNMAADEALLTSALEGTASLRFYGWSTPTVSLGYFQHAKLRQSDEKLATLPFVRRPTGGSALIHHHELTYALALPPEIAKQGKGQGAWLCRMHKIIARALNSLDIHAATVSQERPFDGLLCFQHQTPGDLTIKGAKVVGSAQRKQRGALLQHGAILLATSPHARNLPGIRELTGRDLPVSELIPAIEREFIQETGWTTTPAGWIDTEQKRVENLDQSKYSQAAWNEKR
jgi:lipoyl(octanoyl) transferase